MIIGLIADNLGGGSARIGEAIIKGLIADDRVNTVIVYSNPRITLPSSPKIVEVCSDNLVGWCKTKKRISLVDGLPKQAIVLNLTNFPIGFNALNGRREIVLLHNAYFFALPEEVSILRSPLFVLRNSIARALMLHWRIFFSSSKATTFMVQSSWMLTLTCRYIPKEFYIHLVRPHRWFSTEVNGKLTLTNSSFDILTNECIENCWFYPATGENHKNHNLLLELLSEALNLNPNIKLILTLPITNSNSKKIISKAHEFGVEKSIINVGWVDESSKNYLMKHAGGIIFLSRFESLGLPLLEIRDLGRPSLVLFSEIAQEILGNTFNLYDLFSSNPITFDLERKRFSYDLADSFSCKNENVNNPDIRIEQAYFFDPLGL